MKCSHNTVQPQPLSVSICLLTPCIVSYAAGRKNRPGPRQGVYLQSVNKEYGGKTKILAKILVKNTKILGKLKILQRSLKKPFSSQHLRKDLLKTM